MAGTVENVAGLVHVAAYTPEVGVGLGEPQRRFPLSPLDSNLTEKTYPVDGEEAAVQVTIKSEAHPGIFAAAVPAAVTEVLTANTASTGRLDVHGDGFGRKRGGPSRRGS